MFFHDVIFCCSPGDLAVSERVLEVRYEAFARDRSAVAEELGQHLGVPAKRVNAALGEAHAESIGRYRRELIARGVFEMPENIGRNHLMYAHTEEDVDRTLEISREALRATLAAAGG